MIVGHVSGSTAHTPVRDGAMLGRRRAMRCRPAVTPSRSTPMLRRDWCALLTCTQGPTRSSAVGEGCTGLGLLHRRGSFRVLQAPVGGGLQSPLSASSAQVVVVHTTESMHVAILIQPDTFSGAFTVSYAFCAFGKPELVRVGAHRPVALSYHDINRHL